MSEVPRFARRFFDPASRMARVGEGELGGKAQGLARARAVLEARDPEAISDELRLDVPALVVLASGFFETFVERNRLAGLLESGADDREIAAAFHAAPIPAEMVGDLRALAAEVRVPLAVRSSSALEDALGQPFAGVYGTKMIPCNQPDAEARFRSLLDAIKFVWASTYFAGARAYLASTSHRGGSERMAVIVQEVVGRGHGERFYPDISGVARSYSFYSIGGARPEEGVADLAVGLGKTIVDGGVCWTFSPARPKAAPPFASARDRMRSTQTEFWSVRVGAPPPHDPMAETEFLVRSGLGEAEADGALRWTASTYEAASDRLWPGLGRAGPRVIDFAPLLTYGEIPLATTLRDLLTACEHELGVPVEIEFALSMPPREPVRFGLLQVRPLFVSSEIVELDEARLSAPDCVVRSRSAFGNGRRQIEDVLVVDPERFEARATPAIALELERLNRALVAEGPSLVADRFRALGQLRSLAGDPRAVGSDLVGAGDRRGGAARHEPRAEPGLPLLPQPVELRGALSDRPRKPGRSDRLGIPDGATGARCYRACASPALRDPAANRSRRPQPPGDRAPGGGRVNRGADSPFGRVLHDLQERAKELACLYQVDEILSRPGISPDEAVREILSALPAGWQYPDACVARVTLGRRVYEPESFELTPWSQMAEISVRGQVLGRLEVFYTRELPGSDEGPFLAEERKLISTLAERLASFLTRRGELPVSGGTVPEAAPAGWGVILEFLRQTDRVLFGRLGRKMINHLCSIGVEEAERLLRETFSTAGADDGEENRPLPRAIPGSDAETAERAFRLAPAHLNDHEILILVEGWIREEKTTYLKQAVERVDTPLPELIEALARFRHSGVEETDLSLATQLGLRASLVRRFLTDQRAYLNTAKQVIRVADFDELAQRIVAPAKSHGRLGGKSAGLFLAARVLARADGFANLLGGIRIPKSWYIPSDGILDFIAHNDLADVHNRKYLEPDRIRLEYPHLVQLFKNSLFSPEILRGLSTVLDDIEGRPIIVRSSSLLEDRLGSAFSGKYKSLFLANTGSKREQLGALTDAIAEVYASVFSPDPIEYRARRGFLDMHEEMGILIQEVVGRRIGTYFLPVFSGVGFSNNEFRWSPRIRREDGLLRLVPGLGTRAVDRLADDYPVLVAPGRPGLRINQSADEALRYSPKKIDVINLETGSFETIDLRGFLARHGESVPSMRRLLSVVSRDGVRPVTSLIDFAHDELIVSFEGLISGTPFVARMAALLRVLRERLETPVDIEFASDGEDVFLLQCRPQGATLGASPAVIPADPPRDRVLFTANRYVSNGRVGEITHVVYVDPESYGRLDPGHIRDVSRAVGRLNRLLPKRQFVLMGPGRWGSRGDIRLGVPVGYSDISNAAVLIEIARQRGGYVPDLSFGTHFFQDLVESSIRYLPLYPDDPEVVFAEPFFRDSANALADLLPEYAHLADVVHVIDVPRATGGLVLRVLMNGDLDQAIGLLGNASGGAESREAPVVPMDPPAEVGEIHWPWRQRMAQSIAEVIDAERLGVRAIYLLGSAKNATAGPDADIDLLVHVDGDAEHRRTLELWLDGWSRALAEVNFLRTGCRVDGLLDVRYVDDREVAAGIGAASKIDAVTDPARPLPLRRAP